LKSLAEFIMFGKMNLNMIAGNPKDPKYEKCIENQFANSDNDPNIFTRHG